MSNYRKGKEMRKFNVCLSAMLFVLIAGCVTQNKKPVETQLSPPPAPFAAPADAKVVTDKAAQSPDTHCGIDFWKYDRLHVPDYNKSRNMIQNPSFEAGLRYYAYPSVGIYRKTEFDQLALTDSQQAKFGGSSLLMRAFTNCPVRLQTFVIPVFPGKKYTVSVYAKGDKPHLQLGLYGISAKWDPQNGWFGMGSCAPTAEWKRYNFSFTAPNNAVSVVMNGNYGGNKDSAFGNIWIDGLQMEEGDLTDFTEKPLAAELLTSDPDNFLQPQTPINARLKIAAPPGTAGKVSLNLEDFFYRSLWTGNYSFKTDQAGLAYINLPLDGKLPKGIFVLRADFETAKGVKDTDYFRLAIMDFLDGKHRNRYITSWGMHMRNSRAVDVARRNMRLGIGGTDFYNINEDAIAYIKILEQFGIKSFSSDLKDSLGKTLPALAQANPYQYFGKITEVTPELEKEVEQASFETVKMYYPTVTSWFFTGESTHHLKALDAAGKMDDIARLQIAAYRGAKRFNTNITFLAEGGHCNMGARNGILWTDNLLQAEKKLAPDIKFDAVAIHPYRARPEDPDLDYETAEFLKMLDRNGYGDVPVIWNESIYHTHYVIPPWGLDTHRGCSSDHYYAGCPSYHMGWGERISAAYWTRHWLVALKYQDRIAEMNGHYGWNYMDAYLTPLAVQKIPNTLGRLLGNAVFKQDIRFAPNVRCYVFEDESKRPVAALWSHIMDVDKGMKECPEAEIVFSGKIPEVFDLMEAEQRIVAGPDGSCVIPVSSFPIFLRGETGSVQAFCNDLNAARLKGKEYLPVEMTVQPQGLAELGIQFRNLTTREFTGQAEIDIQGRKTTADLQLKGLASKTVNLPLPEKLACSRIATISVPVVIKEKNRPDKTVDASFHGFAVKKLSHEIKVDGNEKDWEDIPAIPITNQFIHTGPRLGDPKLGVEKDAVGYPGDFEAWFKTAWDDKNFYLLVKVVDDKHCPPEKKTGIWAKDSLQVYIDTYGDNRLRSDKGFDGNDYNYDFGPDPENTAKLAAWRGFCPEWQLTLQGGLKLLPSEFEQNLVTVFKKVDEGYLYEIVFPKAYLAPMRFGAGTTIGFGLFLNDNDGGASPKRSLTLTPEGMSPYQNPNQWPVMMLVE